ncbi:uncharacterized protein [Apostichopus japonicus]|uniref:uncharacterized protein isoform X3 n=1 Tax=Stichopus japonicus TaxID=307972 RepID=UPI003AB6EB31
MANAWMIGESDVLRYVIKRELKEHGVKIGKLKGNSRTYSGARNLQDKNVSSPVFGVALKTLPCCKDLQTGLEVPRFVKECVEFLSQHLHEEGLFRKSGSHSRQKDLQNRLSKGESIATDCQVADVAGVLKRFFRDLPEPIIHPRYQAWILKCVSIDDEILQEWTTLILLCLLPTKSLQLLRFIMLFLSNVASHSESNRMDAKNLALVLTPTIFGGEGNLGKTVQIERQIKLQTLVIETLINNAKDIGVVPDYILDRMVKTKTRSNEALDNLTSEDELEKSSDDNLENNFRNKRKKRRSGTFHGIVNGLGQVGQKVGELLKSSGSLDNLDKTPENVENVETPRTLRSSKRKASDDIGSFFSATKRKAILRQMTVDPHYGKRGVNIHKGTPSSPMTPLQSMKPALGEIDALDSEGKMLFHFNTPSIKFADDSFSGFSSTPSTSSAAEPLPAGVTPRRNKLKKLNPLNSRRFKSAKETVLSLGAIGGSSRNETPLKLPQPRQNNPYHSKYTTHEENVGHRLAHRPNSEVFDTQHLVPRHPECREISHRCPVSQSDKDVSSTMYTPPSYLMKDASARGDKITDLQFDMDKNSVPEQKSRGYSLTEAKPSRDKGYNREEEPNDTLDVRRCYNLEEIETGNSSKVFAPRARSQSCLSAKCAPRLTMCLSSSALEDDAMLLGEDYSPRCTINPRKRETSVADRNALNPQQRETVKGDEMDGEKWNSNKVQYLKESESQKSLSSVLSNVTVNSTRSYFSVEAGEETIVASLAITNDKSQTPAVAEISSEECEESSSMEVDENVETQSEPILSYNNNYKISSTSLDTFQTIPSENKTAEWILKKTISVDSGRGESIEDLEPQPNKKIIAPQAGLDQGSNIPKVNPSKLRPLKVDHDDSSMKQFHIMQRRLHLDPSIKERKTVQQKIKMFNSLSEDDLSDSGRDGEGSVRLTKHHSSSDLPVSIYKGGDANGSLFQSPGKPLIESVTVSLSPLVKSMSYDSGLKEIAKHTTEEASMPVIRSNVRRELSSNSSDGDSFEAAMDSAKKALSNFKRFAAESSTPSATRKPLGDKNSWNVNQARPSPKVLPPNQVDSLFENSPAISSKSPTYRKHIKRLHIEESPNWQRRSPREKFRREDYMHLLKSPRDHRGSPKNPLLENDKKGRRRSRHVRQEWQV